MFPKRSTECLLTILFKSRLRNVMQCVCFFQPRNPDLVDEDVHRYDTLGKQSFRHKSRWMIVIALVIFFIIACAIVTPVTVKILEDGT